MTQAQWHARIKSPRERANNPISGAFFADETIDKPAQALVRELLQNACDARSGSEPARVRIEVCEGKSALHEPDATFWFAGLWEHLRAEDSGVVVAARPAPMRFLVVEDFNTTGLTGDVARSDAPSGAEGVGVKKNERFYAFLRAEGHTSKGSGGGGSWGVGKTVFCRSSEINTIFVLSVRKDKPHRVLIGQSLLRFHRLNGKQFGPDVMWGLCDSESDVIRPTTQDQVIERFVNNFHVRRRNESGLSVVVPMLDKQVTAPRLLEHAICEYFLPILRGQLVVEVHGQGLLVGGVVLDQHSLVEHMKSLNASIRDDLLPLIELAKHIRDQHKPLLLEDSKQAVPKWSQLIPDNEAKRLSDRLVDGEILFVRVPVLVRCAGQTELAGHFDIVMRHEEEDRPCRPVYIREGIVIPKVRERGLRNVRVHSIVLAEGADNALADLLRDAEGPGHTHWSVENKQHFRTKYENGPDLISFVERAPRALAERLLSVQQDRDTTSFADDFPTPIGDQKRKKKKRKKADITTPPPPPPPLRPRLFVIDERHGGFIVRRADAAMRRPAQLRVRVAYDRTGSDPFKHYHIADFKLNQAPIRHTYAGVREVKRHENVLHLDVVDDDFRVEVEGFDANRDLRVDVKALMEDGQEDASTWDVDDEHDTDDEGNDE